MRATLCKLLPRYKKYYNGSKLVSMKTAVCNHTVIAKEKPKRARNKTQGPSHRMKLNGEQQCSQQIQLSQNAALRCKGDCMRLLT
jgi:hypothetical protein